MIHTLKALYITILAVIVMLIALLIGSFIFLERTSHKEYDFDIRVNDKLIGNISVDRFATEDRLTYKTASLTPMEPVFVESKSKMSLNRKYSIESYVEEKTSRDGIISVTAIESNNKRLSFLSRFQSNIVYMNDLPVSKDTFIFIEDSPVTYMPIIENYDFRKGRSQGFNVITPSSSSLPPLRRYATFTSIRDEYLKIDGRKIKAENLILKIRNYPQCSIWVAKSDRKLLMMEFPGMNKKIIRSFRKKEINIKDAPPTSGPFIEKEVAFKSKGAQLIGTITAPEGASKLPAILLIPGYGSYVKDYGGFSEALAGYFAKNGFTIFRFNRRGIGKSSGDANWPDIDDFVQDINAAIEFMAGEPEIDANKISILAHGEGASAAAMAAVENKAVGSLVFMAPVIYSITDYDSRPELAKNASEKNGWTPSYKATVLQASQDTAGRIRNSKFGWAYILGKRCYIGEMKKNIDNDPLETIKKIKIPVLIVQGKDDTDIITESTALIDNSLKSAGNMDSSLIYYGYLGHFFGQPVIDGVYPMRYDVSTEVLYSIANWIKSKFAKTDSLPPKPAIAAGEAAVKI